MKINEYGFRVEKKYGTIKYYLHGKFHREDGPAVECANGNKYWYLHGELCSKYDIAFK